ncbi:MAG: transposase [Candidatus Dormibacteria bacterium]
MADGQPLLLTAAPPATPSVGQPPSQCRGLRHRPSRLHRPPAPPRIPPGQPGVRPRSDRGVTRHGRRLPARTEQHSATFVPGQRISADTASRHQRGQTGGSRSRLAQRALAHAVHRRRPDRGLIHHSDQGSPYRSWAYQEELKRIGARPSMGRKGQPGDNTCIESWNSTLERELLAFHTFRTSTEAERSSPSAHQRLDRPLQPPPVSLVPGALDPSRVRGTQA